MRIRAAVLERTGMPLEASPREDVLLTVPTITISWMERRVPGSTDGSSRPARGGGLRRAGEALRVVRDPAPEATA